MARPRKQGLEWFPMDVNWCDDERVGMIEAEFGMKGFAVLTKLYMKIFREQGYFLLWDKRVAALFADRQCRMGCAVVCEIVSACIREGIFDAKMFQQYSILTSAEIQETFFQAVQKRAGFEICKKYLLVSAPKFVSTSETPVSSTETDVYSSDSTQSKSNSYRDSNSYTLPITSNNTVLPSVTDTGTDGSPEYKNFLAYTDAIHAPRDIAISYYNAMQRQHWCDRSGKTVTNWHGQFQRYLDSAHARQAHEDVLRTEKAAKEREEEAMYSRLREQYLAECLQPGDGCS